MNALAARQPAGRADHAPGQAPVRGVTARGIGLVFAHGVGILDQDTIRLAELLDPGFLAEAGWDPVDRTLRLAPEHPLLGRTVCAAPGCRTTCGGRPGVCLECRRRLDAAGLGLADVAQLPPPQGRRWLAPADGACLVVGCPRPWTRSETPLCHAHRTQCADLGVTIDDFVTTAGVTALPSFGVCAVAACHRQLPARGDVYCGAHVQRWRAARRAGEGLDEPGWRATEPPVPQSGLVNWDAIRPQVVVQLLFGLQQRTRHGAKTSDAILRSIGMDVRRQGVSTLADYAVPPQRGHGVRCVVTTMVTYVRRGLSGPDTEIVKDTWDMTLFGHRGVLSFTRIHQPWLRQAAKTWALSDLPRRRGRAGQDKTRHHLSSLALLSDSLHHRPDHGDDPAVLGRADIEVFLNRLAYLQSTETISPLTRLLACREVRKVLTALRQLGVTGPGHPAAGLSDQFGVHRDDIPAEPDQPEPGRDLPAAIMRQLCDQLDLVPSPRIRTAIEILIDTGRRPEEVLALPLDCLSQDSDGAPVLVYDDLKNNRRGRRLPIPATTAETIRAQQHRARARYPAAPAAALKLLPSGSANRDGSRPMTAPALSTAHRAWVDTLTLLLPDGSPYDKDRVVPYAYRHTYAQRHADAGAPIDVLAELLGHRNLNVTRRYYRVEEHRRRQAVEKTTMMAFDRHGDRVWHQAAALLDSEHARNLAGDVTVPYGRCTQPPNVHAAGTACPTRFRCTDCAHFHTDIAHLPDLTAYLEDLLRTRERLTAATDIPTGPTDEQITQVRRLIARLNTGITELSPTDRTQIHEAITMLRRHRSTHLTTALTRPRDCQ